MKAINDFENVKATTGEFSRPTAGGYVVELLTVKDVPINEQTGKGDYLKIDYDICFGEFAGYYTKQNERFGGDWFANFIRSYKESAAGMFKHFINCVEESNVGYKWSWDEKSLVHKLVGVVLGEEEYKKSNGDIGVKLVVKDIKTVEQIKNGDFKVPNIKRITEESSTSYQAKPYSASDTKFETIVDETELPF
jgi:hypothetical protein